jgi:VWFA-related protein
MPSHQPESKPLISGMSPKLLKQSLAIFVCSAAIILISWTAVLRAAPQSQAPPPPPAAKQQTPPADSATSQASRPALRVVQQMVQVDIIAKDRDGKPVQNLKQSDFTVYDNGGKQDISFFSMETDQTRNLPRPQLSPGTYSNLIEQKQGVPGNLTILLLDFLNTKHSDIVYAKERILKLLHDMKPDDRVAVYVLSGRLYVLHDFTSDMTALSQSVKKYNTVDSADVANSDFKPTYTGILDVADDAFINESSQAMSDFANIDRASTTTNVFEIIAQHMMRLPGRKNLIWVSGSFPFSMNTDKSGNSTNLAYESPGSPLVPTKAYAMFGTGNNSPQAASANDSGMYLYENRSFADEIGRATRALASANIAVYPVDPRGLIGANGVETVSSPGYGIGPSMYNNSTSLANLSPNLDTMNSLASQTGGVAYYNNNDIGGEVRQAMEDSRISYMLAFYPAADDGKGKFHNIKVRVDRPGVELRYRNGYTPKPLNYSGVVDNSAIEREAMASPLDATGLGMTVHTSSVHGAATPTVALRINLEENDVSFKFEDERDAGQIEVMLVQYDTEGNAIWVETSKVKMRLVRDTYAKVRKEGLQFGRNLPLKPGAVELKVIACDDKSSSIGSVSIPLAAYLAAPEK